MRLLLSGEGPSDIGVCYPAAATCSQASFIPGPMAWMVDHCVEHAQQYDFSYIENGLVHFASKQQLVANKPRADKKPGRLPGKKRGKESGYYFYNARALAQHAAALSAQVNDYVIAVLFRDADGTSSSGRGEWQAKYDSMLQGFEIENYSYGVAMVPKPKSEAWLLCAMKPESPYQHCAALEKASGNDDSPNSLKTQLNAACQGNTSAEELADAAKFGSVQWGNIDMPSLNAFKNRLEEVVHLMIRQGG